LIFKDLDSFILMKSFVLEMIIRNDHLKRW